MFWVVDHRTGTSLSGLVPFSAGPRHWGQFSAKGAATRPIRRTMTRAMLLMVHYSARSASLLTIRREARRYSLFGAKRLKERCSSRGPGRHDRRKRADDEHGQHEQAPCRGHWEPSTTGGHRRADRDEGRANSDHQTASKKQHVFSRADRKYMRLAIPHAS